MRTGLVQPQRTTRILSAGFECVSADRIRLFEPRAEWFCRGAGGVHGIAHETRVLILTQVLAMAAGDEGLNVDADVLAWAAAIHDTQRHNDGADPKHGDWAADWIECRPELLPKSVPLERVAYLCRWHVPADERAPEMTDELRLFKDADALDRWRIGDLDRSRLRLAASMRLLDASYSLWSGTNELNDSPNAFAEIVKAATAMGILHD